MDLLFEWICSSLEEDATAAAVVVAVVVLLMCSCPPHALLGRGLTRPRRASRRAHAPTLRKSVERKVLFYFLSPYNLCVFCFV